MIKTMLSVVLATYNEEKNIKRCLESVGFADEIIVVDGSSTDRTREIARESGARVIKTTNKPNFHINKQLAMDEAKGKLVLQLDADEVVDEDLATFISKQLKKIELNNDLAKLPSAWWLKRKNLFLGRFLAKGGQYPDPVIRLYVNGKAKLPQKDVHEQMVVDGETAWAEGHLIHYSNPTFKDYLRKFNTYTSFTAQQMKAQKQRLSWRLAGSHLIAKPLSTFLSLFIRHKGFVDGVPGFVFALMSGLHHPIAYLKFWELNHESH
jgi:glycosyltransferase involved in cell wall biosynthesis